MSSALLSTLRYLILAINVLYNDDDDFICYATIITTSIHFLSVYRSTLLRPIFHLTSFPRLLIHLPFLFLLHLLLLPCSLVSSPPSLYPQYSSPLLPLSHPLRPSTLNIAPLFFPCLIPSVPLSSIQLLSLRALRVTKLMMKYLLITKDRHLYPPILTPKALLSLKYRTRIQFRKVHTYLSPIYTFLTFVCLHRF